MLSRNPLCISTAPFVLDVRNLGDNYEDSFSVHARMKGFNFNFVFKETHTKFIFVLWNQTPKNGFQMETALKNDGKLQQLVFLKMQYLNLHYQ